MPSRPAMAVRCTMALVEPPTAISTRMAFSTDFSVMTWRGVMRLSISCTAALPVSSAATSRSACTAGIAAVPGSDMPSASVRQAIVEAVPITAQVPAVTESRPSTVSISSESTEPARYLAQKPRQSVQAPSRWPLGRPVDIGPVTSWMAGSPAEAAPISWAGTVLSQPPISTAASMGWAPIISSVSMAMRLRYIMLVGFRNTSPSEMVGKGRGNVHRAVDRADLIIAIGHDTVEKPPFLMGAGGPQVIHIGYTPANVEEVYFPQAEVVGDVGPSLTLLAGRLEGKLQPGQSDLLGLRAGILEHITKR